MAFRALFNQLELSFAPICNYDFALIKEDEGLQRHLRDSTLYIIAQRPELTIDLNEMTDGGEGQVILHFSIRQKGHSSQLSCQLPVYQEAYGKDVTKEFQIGFQYALPVPDPMIRTFPHSGIRNLLLSYHDGDFIGWIAPEIFIQNYLNGAIEATVEGPINDFLTYQVHYVGKATEQSVLKRLTGHSTLQEILSLEYPFHFGTLPTHEIAVLFFRVRDPIGILTIGTDEPIPADIVDVINGSNLPSNRVLSLDAEKALIQAMKPSYNKVFYNNYPGLKDALSAFQLDSNSYQINSHIILHYNGGTIRGCRDSFADALVVKAGEPLRVIQQGNAHEEFRSLLRMQLGEE